MPTNPYFDHFTADCEQDLVEDLIIEAIQIYGLDIIYLPREFLKKDEIFGEDVLSKFTDGFKIEAYIKNVEGWEGDGDFLSKFGLEIRDQMTLVIAQRRWSETMCKKMNIDRSRPREGDLIYIKLDDKERLFEIKFVEHEAVYYQLGRLYTYELKLEMFEHSDEDIDTGSPIIDQFDDEHSYQIEMSLDSGSGTYVDEENIYQGADFSSATATGEVVSWDEDNLKLVVKNITGVFNLVDNVIGDLSGASYSLVSAPDTQDNVADDHQDNVDIEIEADNIYDFSETDPFSEGNF